jgi:plastocyanin
MKRLYRLGLICLLLPAHRGPDSPVTVKLFQFAPDTLVVPVGTRVVWTNADAIEHTVTSGEAEKADGHFAGVMAGKGAAFAFTFTQPGAYRYFCDRHHFMRGEIRVTSTGKEGN